MTVTFKLEGYLNKVHTIAPKSSGEVTVTLSVDEAARRAKAEGEPKAKPDVEAKAKANKRARQKRAAKSSHPGLF